VDQEAIGWINPSAFLISLLCGPGRIGSFLLVTNEPTAKTNEKTNLKLLRDRLRGRAARFDVMYEFISTRQDRLKVIRGQALMVSSEHTDSLRYADELLDWETQCTVHASTLQTTRDKDRRLEGTGVQPGVSIKRRRSSVAASHIPNAARS
jgi:hypothetical protein